MNEQFLRSRPGQGQGQDVSGSKRRGRGGGNKPGSGPSGNCICPKCGFLQAHQRGERCIDITCPKCGTKMIRE
jgi:hypothetical protein